MVDHETRSNKDDPQRNEKSWYYSFDVSNRYLLQLHLPYQWYDTRIKMTTVKKEQHSYLLAFCKYVCPVTDVIIN
jgi:hypothetical protein